MEVCKANHGMECIKCTPGPCDNKHELDIPMPPVKEPKDEKEQIQEAFRIIQTQILEMQQGMNKLADAIIELGKIKTDKI